MLKSTVVLSAVFLLVCAVQPGQGFTTSDETSLRTALFATAGYDVSVRPNGSTTVSLSLVPTSLNNIDIKAQTMSISGWWDMTWEDERLTWAPSSYANIAETHVFQDEVWTPTIVVYNSVNNLAAIDEDTIPLRILSTGTLQWSPPGILLVSCSTDIRFFPFDSQTCSVSVKTFGYTIQELVLEADADDLDLSYYSKNGEWNLLDAWTSNVDFRNYSQVTFYFKYKRKPAYYGLNLIMPVMMMAVLGLFIFVLPAESGEKMGFSLTVMLTFVVLMTILGSQMPTTADHTSVFEVYVILVLTLCSMSVVFSIISLNLYFREVDQPVPKRYRDVTRFVVRLLCKEEYYKKQTFSTPVTKLGSASLTDLRPSTRQRSEVPEDAHDEQEVTWKMMSHVLDAFLLRAYIAVTALVTLITFCNMLAG
ncbi:acetylcholine receptor subunit beta-type lev-1-like [Littorina saxatilis]|uniref:acetylcholine receptor subunit beta-type lev-1-like n=1 Tax=Littorina saxatilis TaxID=31220 RepID=UPI0038B668DE